MGDIKDSINYLLDKSSQSEEVRNLAISITRYSPDPIASIYDFVRNNVQYTPDPVKNAEQIELFISPVRMVKDYYKGKPLAGDCDDMALLTTALCRSIGIRSNVIILDTEGNGFDHAVAQVYSEKLGKYIMIDASTDEVPLGWEIKYYSKVVI